MKNSHKSQDRSAVQLTMFKTLGLKSVKNSRAHGGGLNAGRRKEMRPLDRRKTIHVTMRSSKARGPLSLRNRQNFLFIAKMIRAKVQKFHVKVGCWANVGNHLHLEVKIQSRKEFGQFLKSLTGLIARHVSGARKGKKFGKFWDDLVYTRVLSSRKEELSLQKYILLNQVEGADSSRSRAELEILTKFPASPPG